MARKISTIDISTTALQYEETIDSVTSTFAYWPLAKDAVGNVLLLRELVVEPNRGINTTNDSTYADGGADTWLNNTESGYISRFDAAMQACIISYSIPIKPDGASEVTTIARQIFLLSETEVGGSSTLGEGESYLSAFLAHAGTTNANTARIAYNSAGAAYIWWLRSAASATQSRHVHSNGGVGNINSSTSWSYLRPAFWVSADTLVSDETEDTIYILPDAAKTYRELEFVAQLGSSQNRPKKAKVMVDITHATESSIWISNNAKDDSPVWVTCENGGVVELPNTVKTTDNWELGVKIYAKSGGRATVGEPALIVEVDG